MPPFEHAIAATRGARDYQEDTAAFMSEGGEPVAMSSEGPGYDRGGFAVLADGMGGHAGGALASKTVCENFLEFVASARGEVGERLVSGLGAANAAVASKIAENPLLAGMGSTLIGAAFGPAGIEWVSVGDSPLFLFRRGEVALLNEDHSLAPELDRMVAEGKLTAAEARHDPRRHMLRSAVTGEEIDLLDVSQQPLKLEPGDYVVLASDGIATLETGEIARLIQGYAKDGAAAVAKAIIRAIEALREPYQDNATVLVVRAVG
ncbi:MAG: serine/threonine-protein phosphatase [Proteobacteria bacterium]|nr:serine/threonine-protein phosphatase [Pseudomonadota bacterium]